MRFVTSLIINGGQLQFLVGAPENGDKVLHIFFIYKNTLYKNDENGQKIKNIVRILPS